MIKPRTNFVEASVVLPQDARAHVLEVFGALGSKGFGLPAESTE